MLNTPFSPWPCYSEDEANNVRDLVLSNRVNYWTGEETKSFEKEFAEYISTEHALAVANGSVALELAIRTCNLKPNDEVVVTPRSFIASVSAVVLCGGTPIFAEVDEDSQNITSASIEKVISSKTKAIVVVHLAGMPADMEPIMELANSRGITVIEDCAQAHGAKYNGKSVGSIGHVAAWSFCQDKIMTTGGEGGMITTNDTERWNTMWSYRDHGKSNATMSNADHSAMYRWLHESFGSNGRMLEYQAVFGRIQLKKLDAWVVKRREFAHRIHGTAAQHALLRVPVEQDNAYSSYYKCYLFVERTHLREGLTRDSVVQEIVDRGVPCFVGSCPEIYLEKAFDNTAFKPEKRLDVAKRLGETSLMFLVHPNLTDAEIDKTCAVISEVATLVSK